MPLWGLQASHLGLYAPAFRASGTFSISLHSLLKVQLDISAVPVLITDRAAMISLCTSDNLLNLLDDLQLLFWESGEFLWGFLLLLFGFFIFLSEKLQSSFKMNSPPPFAMKCVWNSKPPQNWNTFLIHLQRWAQKEGKKVCHSFKETRVIPALPTNS